MKDVVDISGLHVCDNRCLFIFPGSIICNSENIPLMHYKTKKI